MTKDNYISFDDFWQKLIKPKQPEKSEEEVRNEIAIIKKIHQAKGGEG